MKDERTAESPALAALVDEAKDHLLPPAIDWSRMEVKLLSTANARPRDRWLRVSAVVMATAAAAAALVVSRRTPPAPQPPPLAEATLAPEASLVRSTGADVHLSGRLLGGGDVIRAGDELRAGSRAVFERPDRVSWLVEPGTSGPARVRVTSAGETLVLALEEGAVEAQVVPVRSGESFAVDVDDANSRVRIAVHGTHLRVDRSGGWVTVDLTEGVLAIGVPPASGITTGTTVKAPAHVRFDIRDLGTLRVTDAPVRAAIPLGARGDVGSAEPELLPLPTTTAVPHTAQRGPSLVAPPPAPARSAALGPRDAIVAAVRSCAIAARKERGDLVRVTLSSTLELRVSSEGAVESALFTPPLAPDVQACAANVIYAMKLDETGTVTVPIDVSY